MSLSEKQVADLNALHQQTIAKTVLSLVPEDNQLLKMFQYEKGEEGELTGEYVHPLWMSFEQGFSSGSKLYAYNNPIPAKAVRAKVQGQEISLKSAIANIDAQKSLVDKKNYVKNAGKFTENMVMSMNKRLESLMIYGQENLGEVESVNVSTNKLSAEVTLSKNFPVGVFAGSEGTAIDFFSNDTKANNKAIQIVKVSTRDRKITVKSLDIDEDPNDKPEELDYITKGQSIHYAGFKKFEMAGLKTICSSVNKTLFGLDGREHSLWNGNPYPSQNKPMSMSLVLDALSYSVDHGLQEEVYCFTNPRHWNQCNNKLAALRSYDSSYRSSNLEIGSEQITYHGTSGKIKIMPHTYFKVGDAAIFPKSKFKRIGSQNLSFGVDGTDQSSQVWHRMERQSAVYSVLSTCQALFCSDPSKTAWISGLSDEFIQDSLGSVSSFAGNNIEKEVELVNQISSLSARISNLEKDNSELRLQLFNFNRNVEGEVKLVNELSALTTKLSQFETENTDLKDKLSSLSDKVEVVESSVKTINSGDDKGDDKDDKKSKGRKGNS